MLVSKRGVLEVKEDPMSTAQLIATGTIATLLAGTLLEVGALDLAAPVVVVLSLTLSAMHHHNQKGFYQSR